MEILAESCRYDSRGAILERVGFRVEARCCSEGQTRVAGEDSVEFMVAASCPSRFPERSPAAGRGENESAGVEPATFEELGRELGSAQWQTRKMREQGLLRCTYREAVARMVRGY